MRNIAIDNITAAAAASFASAPEARRRELLQALVVALHGYAKTVELTHDEWRAALGFMHRVGDISSSSRSEFSLLSDVMGLSSLVDLIASAPHTTPGSVLGPFHTIGSPWRSNPVDLTPGNAGEPVLLRGRIVGAQGEALPEATLDFWQNAGNGLYWQQDPEQPQDNLRCQLKVDAQGGFAITTIKPRPYQIPLDGPVWLELVGPAGRSAWRPAHFHLIASAPGHRSLVTELFEANDPYLDSDVVFGVRQALVGHYAVLPGQPHPVMDFELRLAAQGQAA